jgi:hypothetical protein
VLIEFEILVLKDIPPFDPHKAILVIVVGNGSVWALSLNGMMNSLKKYL